MIHPKLTIDEVPRIAFGIDVLPDHFLVCQFDDTEGLIFCLRLFLKMESDHMSPLILFQGIIEELFRFRIRIPIVSPDRNAILADVPDSAAFYVIIRTIILLPGAEKKAHLSRKERIALGLIAQNHSMTATEFAKALDLKGDHATRAWLDKLINQRIVLTKGKTRGTEYYINPQVIRSSNFQRKPDLKIIEPHRLRELIYEDIRTYKKCSISEISKRIGPEISRYKIRQQLQALIDAGRIVKEGASSATVYLVKNGGE